METDGVSGQGREAMGVMKRILSDSQLEAMMRKTFKIPAYKG